MGIGQSWEGSRWHKRVVPGSLLSQEQSGTSCGFSQFVLDTPPHSEGLKKIPNLKKRKRFLFFSNNENVFYIRFLMVKRYKKNVKNISELYLKYFTLIKRCSRYFLANISAIYLYISTKFV